MELLQHFPFTRCFALVLILLLLAENEINTRSRLIS